ncbi:hypothetical protein [Paractinoplanes lichenicola]|uniref:Uncharacterized protein n=1 Tax=Paractinoplanes lichenicola TaxID=2802976 RepID=A0ABS1VIG2_9ACTN|nr:hypothetical protein [Actinoplanes lichenicola]MBL7254497.1 hypothetical protein [Actinoplanes lichenicola]
MRSLGTRRVTWAAGVATVAVIALSGCSAGQVAETSILKTPISGLNTQSPDGNLLIRNLQVIYNDPEGYPANGDAPLEVALFNQSTAEMTVLISSRPLQDEQAGIVSARQIGLDGGPAAGRPSANPEPSGGSSDSPDEVGGGNDQNTGVEQPSAQPSQPGTPSIAPTATLQPARITIPPLSSVTYLPEDDTKLVAAGLSDELVPGHSLSLIFEVSGQAQPIELTAPFAIPLSPASRAPGETAEEHE